MSLYDFIEDEDLRNKAIEAHDTAVAAADVVAQTKLDEEVNGLKEKNAELLNEKKKIQDTLSDFDNLDAEKAREALAFLEQNEQAQMIKDGKFDELVAKRTSTLRSEHETAVTTLQQELQEAMDTGKNHKFLYEGKMVEDAIRAAATASGVRADAIGDLIMHGKSVFSLAQDKSVEARTTDGGLLKTAEDLVLTPELWVEGMRKQSPYYWPSSTGTSTMGLDASSGNDDYIAALAKAGKENDQAAYRAIRQKMKGKA